MENINGKWALVTGASRGIGALVADKLADYGCNLVLHSRSVSHLEKVGAVLGVFLSDKKSGRIISAQDFADMSVEDAVKKFEAM